MSIDNILNCQLGISKLTSVYKKRYNRDFSLSHIIKKMFLFLASIMVQLMISDADDTIEIQTEAGPIVG